MIDAAITRRSSLAALAMVLPVVGGRDALGSPERVYLRQARRADRWVDSVGVNVHLSYLDTAYGDFAAVRDSLRYLQVRHIRGGLEEDLDDLHPTTDVLDRYRQLAAVGTRVTGVVPYQVRSMPALVRQIVAQRDVLEAVEGPNETDIFTEFSYQGQQFPQGAIAFMKDLYPAIKGEPLLQDLPVVQTTLAFPGATEGDRTRADLLGDLSAYADFGNSHNYFDFGQPPGHRIRTDHLPLNTQITPGKPVISSEGGYSMGVSDGYKGTYDDGLSAPFSERVHGRYLLRYLLEQFRLGYRRSFVYELLAIDEPDWGLFRKDGSARPAAKGIRTMVALLGEGTWNSEESRWVVPRHTPGRLRYAVSALPGSVHSLLLQKSCGTFYLVMWNDVRNWNARTGMPRGSDPVPLTLRLDELAKVRTFLPLTHGTTATATLRSRRLSLQVPDQPLVVEISAT